MISNKSSRPSPHGAPAAASSIVERLSPTPLLLLLALVGCRPAPCPDGCSPPGLAVIDAPSLGAPCPEDKPCADYVAFAEAHGRSVEGVDALVARLHEAHETGAALPGAPLDPAACRRAVIDGLALTPLLDGLDARPLELREVSRTPAAFGDEIALRLRDPLVGTFNVLLLRPAGEGPFPGVVALPGHGDDPAFVRDRYLGRDLAAAGFAVAIVQLRNHRGGAVESELTHRLLRAGLPLLGLRVYEALLARKVLRWRTDVIPDRLAVMGHSGGAEIAALSARVEPSFRALVIDHQSAYLGVQPDGRWLDDTAPALHAVHPSLNDLSALPVYQDAYEYPRGAGPVVRFLRSRLR